MLISDAVVTGYNKKLNHTLRCCNHPGTGKTTVARLIAKLYGKLGLLQKGQLIEADRSGLVANYIGQTATKTEAVIASALGGVLFIDEAYALAEGGPQDFGPEAIATLIKAWRITGKSLWLLRPAIPTRCTSSSP